MTKDGIISKPTKQVLWDFCQLFTIVIDTYQINIHTDIDNVCIFKKYGIVSFYPQ